MTRLSAPQLAQLQLALEAAWAAAREEADAERAAGGGRADVDGPASEYAGGARRGAVSSARVAAVQAALAQLPPLRAGSEPLVDGKWLLAQEGARPGKLIGRVKVRRAPAPAPPPPSVVRRAALSARAPAGLPALLADRPRPARRRRGARAPARPPV